MGKPETQMSEAELERAVAKLTTKVARVLGDCGPGMFGSVISNLFAIGWGIANVLAGLCAVRIGLALSGAILTGLGVTVVVTVPMVFKGTGLFSESPDLVSPPGLTVVSGVAVMLLGFTG